MSGFHDEADAQIGRHQLLECQGASIKIYGYYSPQITKIRGRRCDMKFLRQMQGMLNMDVKNTMASHFYLDADIAAYL